MNGARFRLGSVNLIYPAKYANNGVYAIEKAIFMKIALFLVSSLALVFVSPVSGEPASKPGNNIKTKNHAFQSGEKLTYIVSWSKILKAGTVTMEVKEEKTPEGRHVYHLTSTAKSSGVVSAFYPVADTAQSILDADELYSLSYTLNMSHGKRKKNRTMTFDHVNALVRTTTNNAEQETSSVPLRVQDSLSSLYYVRTRENLTGEKSIFVDVYDSGKNWSVEVQILGKEKIKTPAGEFDTIKVKTYPKYEGVFQNKGEIFIWFTDDARRIPVFMKSTISIGSIVATLSEMKLKE